MDEPADRPSLDCHVCGKAMRLANVVPKLGPHPALHSFKCDNCGEVRTITINGDDEGKLHRGMTVKGGRQLLSFPQAREWLHTYAAHNWSDYYGPQRRELGLRQAPSCSSTE
jgi:hypothetical protein